MLQKITTIAKLCITLATVQAQKKYHPWETIELSFTVTENYKNAYTDVDMKTMMI
jgi:hypothetical protein